MGIEQPTKQTPPESRRHFHHCAGCHRLVVVEDGVILRHDYDPPIKCMWSGYSIDGTTKVIDV